MPVYDGSRTRYREGWLEGVEEHAQSGSGTEANDWTHRNPSSGGRTQYEVRQLLVSNAIAVDKVDTTSTASRQSLYDQIPLPHQPLQKRTHNIILTSTQAPNQRLLSQHHRRPRRPRTTTQCPPQNGSHVTHICHRINRSTLRRRQPRIRSLIPCRLFLVVNLRQSRPSSRLHIFRGEVLRLAKQFNERRKHHWPV